MRVDKQPEPVQIPKPFVAPQPIGKIVALIAAVVASAVLFWYAWSHILNTGINLTGGSRNVFGIIGTLLAFCLMLSLAGIAAVVIYRIWYVWGMGVLAAVTVFIFFPLSVWSLLAAVILLLTTLYWHHQIRIDAKSRITATPNRTIGTGLRATVSMVLLVASLLYYSSLMTGPDAQQKFTDSMVSTGTTAVQNILDVYYEERFRPSMTLDEFILNISSLDNGIKLSTGQENLDRAIQEGFDQAQSGLVREAREEFLKTFGIEAAGDEMMSSVIEKIVRKNLNKYVGPYTQFIPVILAVGLFFLLNVFNFVYSELIKSFSYVIFQILVWLKFIKVQKVQVEAEKITL